MKKEKIKIEPLNWWESKRVIYNLALLSGAFLADAILSTGSQEFSYATLIWWIFGANVFYTMSWAIEILYYKFFNTYPFNKVTRKIIFIIGTLFSLWWTCIGLQSWAYYILSFD